MAALRLARGATGRDGYVILEGSYHGLFDAVMWQADVESLGDPSTEPDVLPFGKGVPGLVRELFWHVPYNDADRLEDVLKRHADRIAAVLIEPILGSCCGIPATPEFFRAVRELCTRHGVLMIVDEVKTGFRVARGGRAAAPRRQGRHLHDGQGDGQRLSRSRPSAGARTSCATPPGAA